MTELPFARVQLVDDLSEHGNIQRCEVWLGDKPIAQLPITGSSWKKYYSKGFGSLKITLNSDYADIKSRQVHYGSKRT